MKNWPKFKSAKWTTLTVIALAVTFSAIQPQRAAETTGSQQSERAAQIEAALFTRSEFFGAQAIVPYPTAEARTRLAELARRFPADGEIQLKLAELEEKLGNADAAQQAMLRYVESEKNSVAALRRLAEFYDRRARFADEATTLERLLAALPAAERPAVLSELIELARRHRLEKYWQSAFFQQLIASDPAAFEVVRQFIQHLTEKKDYAGALEVIHQYRASFPVEQDFFLQQEVNALVALKRGKEAEAVYVAAFDPFWSREQSQKFYFEFLSGHDRLRAYGRELKAAFRRDPANFDVAIRYCHYSQNDNYGGGEGSEGVLTELERARATRGIRWKPEELAIAARLLLTNDEAEAASRFLYTLQQTGNLQRGSELRQKVIYQIFELLLDAGDERTALTAGDLKFYQDVAKSDPHPGMLGGVLSLVLADSDPQDRFERAEKDAVAHFNRASAYRVFNTFKQEYPTSPALAQMYLDLIRLHVSGQETAAAAALLEEFSRRYSDAPQFAEVALKLADGYIQQNNHQREREVYQQALDHLGKQRKADQSLVPAAGSEEPTTVSPPSTPYPPNTNYGYSHGDALETERSYYSESRRFRPVALIRRGAQTTAAVSYSLVLSRYVASLMLENRTANVLALYAAELKKYPDEQGLYEQMLQWLGQTNLTDEQLRVYQEAIKRFQTNLWTDRLARWYLRKGRQAEFENFSRDLLAKMNDREIEDYLNKFVQVGTNEQTKLDANLRFGLYNLAHNRFPHNERFIEGLLNYYAGHKRWDDWQRLLAEHYFESKTIRERYLSYLAGNNRLRDYSQSARGRDNAVYKLFRADAAVWLSNFEDAVEAYRELNRLYPNTPEFAERLVALTRSFGQKDQTSLEECARVQLAVADAWPASGEDRTRAGEVFAELGDYKRAAAQWEKLLSLGAGDDETFLETATIYWDYFQYDDALRVLKTIRRQKQDDTLYAFQVAAILESQHKTKEALTEYVKNLHPHSENYRRAKARLKTLSAREGIPQQLRQALAAQLARTRNADRRDGILLGYVYLLNDLERWPEAAPLLKRQIPTSNWEAFLDDAQELFSEHDDAAGEQAVLRRLTAVARTERLRISYRLQLAVAAEKNGQKENAAALLSQLVAKYPTNYGVLSETADFYWRLGKREQSMRLLAQSVQRGKGLYRYVFARKLAARQSERGHLAAAEATLKKLYDENPGNLDVFRELSKLYVRQSKVDALRERYRQTIRAVKEQETDHLALRQTVAQLREQVIEAFTQLRDFNSAIEQHIEIINRNPDDEDKVKAAVEYAKRYGGGETMIAYYLKASQQAFKDYRWNLVLARLYDAKNDFANARTQLQKAIHNQPEMIELHEELADVCLRAKDYNTAVESLKLIAERTNDDPNYLKRLAEAYDKAGRKREADAVRAKLPVEMPKAQTLGEQFATAAALPREQRAKAIETYRKAFDAFSKDFYKHELSAYELGGYISALRDEEPLDQILRRLWEVRERIRRDAAGSDNLLAGKAKSLLQTFDRTIPDAVGKVASEFATGEELAAVHRSLQQWISAMSSQDEADGTQAVLLNLSYRAGFNDLAERVLIARKDAAAKLTSTTTVNAESVYSDRLMTLLNFYSERGAYRRIVELTEQEAAKTQKLSQTHFRAMIAEYARLVGDGGKELAVLRAEFQSHTGNLTSNSDALVERYFEALLESGESGRGELQQVIAGQTPHRFQLINFLLRNNEKELASAAIKAAPLNAAWQNARQAELSLAARDTNASNETYFLAALGWKPIGEMIAAKPDATRQLVGDNWFYLADSYGRWLNLSETSRSQSVKFLPAMLENKPKDAAQQHRLGRWLLEQKQLRQALEHLRLAAELHGEDNATNKPIWADLGSAYFELGEAGKAREQWARIVEGEKVSIEDQQLYLQTLGKHGLQAEARAQLQPLVVWRLKQVPLEVWRSNTQLEKEFEPLKPLLRALAESFGKTNDTAKAAFLRQLADVVPRDTLLPEMIVREALVTRAQLAPFYELLTKRTEGNFRYSSDFDFENRLKDHPTWSVDEIEESQDHAGSGRKEDRESARLAWQKQFLEFLLAERKDTDAAKLIATVEQEFKGRYARPAWLRLAKSRLDVRAGRVAQAVAGLKHFAGIEVSERIGKIAPPQLERLNQAVEMLRREGRRAEADDLLRAAYERQLALEQLDEAPMVGLARLQFAKGDAAGALKQLKLMLDLASPATHSTAAAELSALPQVKARAVEAAWIEKPAAGNQLSLNEALRLAAETAAEFNQFAAAIEWRQRLLELAPEDNACRLELARLLAADKQQDKAAQTLAALSADRRASRQTRWTALWIAPEAAGKRRDVWQSLTSQVRAAKDREAIAAAEALAAFDRGQASETVKLLGEASDIPSNQLTLLRAVLLKAAGQEREALDTFLSSRLALSDSQAMAAFASSEDELRRQVVRLYARLDQPRAALKLAQVDAQVYESLRGAAAIDAAETSLPRVPGLLTLPQLTAARELRSRLEMQALLSAAAERIGEFDKAADFERVRAASLTGDERRKVETRIEQLTARQKQKTSKRGLPLTVDEKTVTAP